MSYFFTGLGSDIIFSKWEAFLLSSRRLRMYVIGVVFKYFENRNCNSLCVNLLSLTSSAQLISLFRLLSIHKQSSSSNALLGDSKNWLTPFVFSIKNKQTKKLTHIVSLAYYINISALNT